MTQDKDEMTQEMRARECLANTSSWEGCREETAANIRNGATVYDNSTRIPVRIALAAMTRFAAAEREREGWRGIEHIPVTPTPEQSRVGRASHLYQRGDMKLAWFNEGDLDVSLFRGAAPQAQSTGEG